MSWGKIKLDATPVKVSSDATIVFPLIVSQTFFKEVQRRQLEVSGAGASAAMAAFTTTIATGVKVETDSDITLKTKKSRIDDFTGASSDATLPVRGEAKV